MRFILNIKMPHEVFNASVRDGTVGDKLGQVLEELKPEAIYFAEYDGLRTGVMIVDIKDPSEIPKYAEPWFLLFNADVEFHPAMTPQELGKAGMAELGKKWA